MMSIQSRPGLAWIPALLLIAATTQAAVITKTNNVHNLNLASSWVSGGPPTAADVAAWDATVTAANATVLGTDASWSGLTVGVPTSPGGNVTINAGNTLTVGASGISLASATRNLTLNCNVDLGAPQVWTVGTAAARVLAVAGNIGGAQALVKDGPGSLTLSGTNNTYNGGTVLLAGTLSLTGGDRLGDAAGGLILTNATTLALTGANATLPTSRALTLAAGTSTISPTTVTLAIEGGIAGAGALTKAGTGMLALNGTNTYAGDTSISAGILRTIDGTGLPAASALVLNGGLLELAGGGTFSRPLGTSGTTVAWSGNGGFSTTGGPLTVNLGGATAALAWGGTANFLGTGNSLLLAAASATDTITLANPIDLGANTRTMLVDNGSATVDAALLGELSGAGGGLIKTGTGTLRLAGTNSFTGDLQIQNGTAMISYLDGSAPGAIVLGSAATAGEFLYEGTDDLALGTRAINLAGTTGDALLTVNGPGTVTVATFVGAANTSTQGKDFILGGSNTGNNRIAGGIGEVDGTRQTRVTKQGAGSWILAGTNTYSGSTTVSAGTLNLGAGQAIPSSSDLTVSGGTLDLQGFSNTVNSLTLVSGLITNGTLLSATSYGVQSGTIAALMTGPGVPLTKTTAGTVALTEANPYSGTVDIRQGTLALNHLNDSVNGSAAILLGSTTFAGTLEYVGSADTALTRAIELTGTTGGGLVNAAGDGTLTISTFANSGGNSTQTKSFTLGGSNTGTNTVRAAITDNTAGGDLALVKSGTGSWRLEADNTYQGTTAVNGGVLHVGVGGTTGTLGTGNFTAGGIAAGAALVINRSGTYTYAGTIPVNGALTNMGPGTVTLSGAISGVGTVTETGAGVLVLAAGNGHTGGTFINGGTLRVGHATALGAATTAKVNFGAGSAGILQMNGFNSTIVELNGDGTAIIENGSATNSILLINNAAATTSQFDGILRDGAGGGTLALTKGIPNSTGALVLTNPGNSYSGDTKVDHGLLKLGAAEVLPHGAGKGNVNLVGAGDLLDLAGNRETINGLTGAGYVTNSTGAATLVLGAGNADGMTFSGYLRDGDGGLSVVKIGTGTQTFSAAAANAWWFNGDVTISNGTLKVAAANTIPNGAGRGNVAVEADGRLDITVAETLNGLTGSGTVTNSGPAGADVLTIGDNDTSSTFAGSIRDGGAGLGFIQLTKMGTGTLTLEGTNTYVGLTTVSAGALRITTSQALGHATVGNTLVSAGAALELAGDVTVAESATINGTGIGNAGALRNASGNNIWTGSISNGLAGTRIQADAGTALALSPLAGNALYGTTLAIVFGGEGDITVNGPIGLTTGNLTKDGGGVLRLNSTDTFTTSKADVQAGTLLANGTLGGTVSVTVQSGATLGGFGTITRAVTNLAGGALAPGDPLVASGVGTLTVKQLQLETGSVLKFELSNETVRDRIVVQNANGTAIGGGPATVPVYLYQPGGTTTFDADGNYDLIDYAGALLGSINALYVANPNPLKTYKFEESGGWVRLTISGFTAWDGGDADDNLWSSGANWSSDSAPAANAELRFDSGLRLSNTNNLGANLPFAGITFNASAGAFTLAGDAIDLTGNIVNSSPNPQTIALPLRLLGNSRQLDAANGPLVVNGTIGETGGTYGLTKTGAQRVTLAGNNTFGGAVEIQSGALRTTAGAALGATNGATTVGTGAALELAGDITTSAEPLTIIGTGVANDGALRQISGTNTYAGLVTMTGPSRIHADDGTLTLDGPAGNALVGTGIAVTFGGNGNIAVVDAIATGAGGTLAKEGTGRLTLAANNTFTGATAIEAGTLRAMHATGLGTVAGGVTVANGAALELDGNITIALEPLTLTGPGVGNGGALRNAGGTNTYQGAITLGTGGARIHADSGALNIRGVTTASGNDLTVGGAADVLNASGAIAGGGRLIKDGTGTFTIGVAATYTGDTIVTNGILRIGIANAILNGATAGNVYVYAGGTLDVATGSDTINGLWGNGKIDNTPGGTARTLTVGDNDQSSLFSGTITNSGGPVSLVLAKTGAGTLTLTGANGHGGGNTISAGTLQIGNGGTGGTLGTGATTIAAGSALAINRAGSYTYPGAISGAGSATLSGPGTIVAGGAWAHTGGTTVNAGSLQLGAADRFAAGTAITINGGTFDINSVDESMGQISLMSGLIASTGDGGSLTGTNIVAASGTIAARLSDIAGATLTPFTKIGGGTVGITRDDNLFAGKVAIQAGTLEVAWLAKLSVGSSLGAPTTAANGTIDLGSDTNDVALRVVGAIGDAFTDRILNLAGTTGRVTLDSSGSGILYVSTNLTATGAGAKMLELTGTQAGTNTLAGAIPDSAGGATALRKSGSGTWVLRAANTYSGGTTVDNGLLVVANAAGSATGSGSVTVNTGATLGGGGSIAGTVTVNSGATLRPGSSVGTLTAGGLSLSAGSLLAFEFNASPTNDQVRITATDGLTINGGGLYLYDEGTTDPWTTPGVYRLFEFAGTIQGSGVAALSVLNPQAGHTYDFRVEGNWVVLRLTAGVPLLTLLDASVTEGNSGTTALAFTLTLDPTGSVAVVANADTSDGTAKAANGDYEARSGAFNIPAGIATTQIVVNVTGELKYENNETLTLALSNVQNATVVRSTATGTINNDDAPDGHVYVDDTATGNNNGNNWDDAFTDLQDALRSAGPGQDIWVAKGTYLPTNGTARTAHFALRPANPVYGGFAGTETTLAQRNWMNATSILSGDIGSPGASFDNCGPIVRTQLGAGSFLDGFTLRDGSNDGVQDSGFGGAMNVRPGFGVTVQNCIFENNYANQAGALQVNADSTFRRCIFRNNADGSRGGAVQCYTSNDLFENCLFVNNTGGGRGGAMSLYHQTITLVNCTFVGNTAQAGNAFYASNAAYVNALNCIFWDSGDHGGGIWVKNPTSNPDPEFNWASGVNLSFCDVRGGFAPPELGTSDNCIDSDPEFVMEGSDYHLTGTSPCRDTGTSSGAPADDLEGGIRPFGPGYDMGAYEYGASGTGTPPTGFMFFVR